VHYAITRCPPPALIGQAVLAKDLTLVPGSAPSPPFSGRLAVWNCNYVPADQYQLWLHGTETSLSVGINLFPKSMVTRRLLQTLDVTAGLRSGALLAAGHIMLVGRQTQVIVSNTRYRAAAVQRLPDGSITLLQIFLSRAQGPRAAAAFRNELQALARISGLE